MSARKMTVGFLVALGLLLFAVGPALAQGGEKVDLSVVLTPPNVSAPVTIEVAFYPIEWGDDGQLRLKQAEIKRVSYDPASPARSTGFAIQISSLVQYQVTVDIIDPNSGYSLEDVTYVYGGELQTLEDEKRVVMQAGDKTRLNLVFAKEMRNPKKGNFLDVFPSSDQPGRFEMALYFGPDQVEDVRTGS